jgi:hypothetical protein
MPNVATQIVTRKISYAARIASSSRALRALLTAGLAVAATAGTNAEPLEPDEFVAGWPLELPAEQGVFDVPLTHEVYRYAQALDRIAVLDRSGEPMPFYRVGAAPAASSEQRVSLGASPLYAAMSGGAAEISVAADTSGASVTLTRPPGAGTADIVAFVVDASEVETGPVAIELDWRELDQPFLFEVTIEHSRTLNAWRPVGRGSVAALSIDGAEIRHARIDIAGVGGGYYRVGADRSVPDWYLRNATLILSDREAEAPLQIARLSASDRRPADAPPRSLYFDADGRLPVRRVALDFAERNGWAKAAIAAADAIEGPWRPIASNRLFYDVDFEGRRFASEPVDVGRIEPRYYRVTFESGPPPRPVGLALEYPTESLRFAAEGEAPFMLVGGTLSERAGPDATFAAVWSALGAAGGAPAAAALGARVELGGAAALEPPFVFPWRSAMLWAVLALAAIAVTWMALRLARDLFKAA